MRKTLLTLKIKYILVMLRLIKEHRTRLARHIILKLKTATTRGGGCPKACKHRMVVH